MSFITTLPILFNNNQRKVAIYEKIDNQYILRRSTKRKIQPSDMWDIFNGQSRHYNLPKYYLRFLKSFYFHPRHKERAFIEFLFPDGQHFFICIPPKFYDIVLLTHHHYLKTHSTGDAFGYIMYFFLYHNNLLSERNKRNYRKTFCAGVLDF